MPLLTRLLRLAIYSLLSWLLLAALWAVLPSPTREYSYSPNLYSLQTLRSGHTLTRVYHADAYSTSRDYVYHHALTSATSGQGPMEPSRHFFALSMRLTQPRGANTTLLTFRDGLSVDLNPDYVTSYPFISQEKYTLVAAGDDDGINLPWFAHADAALLFWWIHRDEGKLAVRVRWRKRGEVELWHASARIEGLGDEAAEEDQSPQGQRPLLRLIFAEGAYHIGALADAAVPEKESSSPSATYALRVVILCVIAPTGLLVIGVFSFLQPVAELIWVLFFFAVKVLACYFAIVAVTWVVRGRRPLAEDDLVSRFPGMEYFGGRGAGRPVVGRGGRTVWGPSGPIGTDDMDGERVARRPIRNVVDFFRSSSPLDDLLASFEITRRFTEPMGWRDRRGYQEDAYTPRLAFAGAAGRHRHLLAEGGPEESGLIDLEIALPEKPGMALKR